MEAIEAALDPGLLNRAAPRLTADSAYQIDVKAATVSTNDDVRALAAAGAPEGAVVFAEEQSAGRGRRGNVWVAPPRRCLLFSILLRPPREPALWPRVTHLAALAVCRAVEPLLHPAAPLVKWPNDVLVGGRKLSGILLESAASNRGGFLILGVGINVNLLRTDFPVDLRATATSLLLETGVPVDRAEVALRFLRCFAALYPESIDSFDGALEEIHRRSALIGCEVTLSDSGRRHSGRVLGFGPNGELRLQSANGAEMLLSSGELVRASGASAPR